MSDLVAIVFDDETTAFEMRSELAKMQKEYLIEMEDAVVVTKDDKGKAKLHQAVNLTAAGAVGGRPAEAPLPVLGAALAGRKPGQGPQDGKLESGATGPELGR